MGYQVTDLRSRAGSLVNGRRFEKHQLVIGDQLQMGPFFFRFDGQALERTSGLAGVEIDAQHVRKTASAPITHPRRREPAHRARAVRGDPRSVRLGQKLAARFAHRPAPRRSGSIRYDGVDFYEEYDRLRSALGYVPQDDIVHRGTDRRARRSVSARNCGCPPARRDIEIRKLVARRSPASGWNTASHTPIHRLSGGQRKRVSVGVELLGRPAVLFLDEPTSGLDPACEFKMMELLRHLADGGCTVICTTHVMENVFLTDRLFVIACAASSSSRGSAQEAREHFGVQKLTMLFDRLEERHADRMARGFPPMAAASGRRRRLREPAARRRPAGAAAACWPSPPNRPAAALPVLLRAAMGDPVRGLEEFPHPLRPAARHRAARRVGDGRHDAGAVLRVSGRRCGSGARNAAQEIVREIPIYRRERMVGPRAAPVSAEQIRAARHADGAARRVPVRAACGRRGGICTPSPDSGRGARHRRLARSGRWAACCARRTRRWASGSAISALARSDDAGGHDRAAGADPADFVFGAGRGNQPDEFASSCSR